MDVCVCVGYFFLKYLNSLGDTVDTYKEMGIIKVRERRTWMLSEQEKIATIVET